MSCISLTWALAFARERGDGEDLAQELALARWQASRRAPGVRTGRTAAFRAIDWMRTTYGGGPLMRAVKGAPATDLADLVGIPDSGWRAPFDAAEARADLALVVGRAVAEGVLRECDARVLLAHAAGATLRAIGEAEGITEAGASLRASKALARLQAFAR